MKRRLTGLLTILLLATAALAQGSQWQIDPAHSTIGFTVRHMGISNVHGRFTKVSGTATIDDNDASKSSVETTIDVASIDTGVQSRDNDLRGANYFDAQQFPTITFKSKSVTKNGNGLKVVGDLTIHGVTKEVTLDVDGPTPPVNAMGKAHRGLSATTTINRKDFGVGAKTPGAMVGEDIKIQLDVELVKG